jgi:two-component system cell cycle sensor histidine kinase/response regulator CckA
LPELLVSNPFQTVQCPRCRGLLEETDRFCRYCGYALSGRSEHVQELHQSIIESIPVGVFTLDSSGRVRYWNRMMEEHRGMRRRDALGRMFFEVLPQLQPFTQRVMQVFDNALPLRLDSITHDGSYQGASNGRGGITESFWFRPLVLEDGTAPLLGVLEDISQKVRVDSQLIRSERLAAIGELAAGVAHNFNNILAAIGGDAQLLKLIAEEERLPVHIIEAASQIYEETMRGGRIAHGLLSFARGGEPEIRVLDVREIVEDAVRLIRNHPGANLITIELSFPEVTPEVEGDSDQLHQVFFGMLLNAVQAMPQGGHLTISAALRSHDRRPEVGMLDVKLHDTGVGISRESLQRVFDPFFSKRANGTTGSGLGLPVSLAMVKGLGGDIQVASVEGIGTTFTISLPIVERRTASRAVLGRNRRGRALVVDDDTDVRRALTTLLTRRGFEVVTAGDGEEALARFEASLDGEAFDLIMTELVLPKVDGHALIRRMHLMDPDAAIIILTGATEPEQMHRALEAGARFGFSKPPNFHELISVAEQLTRDRSSA